MTQFLNLDDFETPVEKVLKLKGKEHVMQPMAVGAFIEQMKAAKKLDAAGEADIVAHLDQMVDMVDKVFPTVGRDTLESLSFEHLRAIIDFTQKSAEAGAPTSKKPVKAKK